MRNSLAAAYFDQDVYRPEFFQSRRYRDATQNLRLVPLDPA